MFWIQRDPAGDFTFIFLLRVFRRYCAYAEQTARLATQQGTCTLHSSIHLTRDETILRRGTCSWDCS